MVGDTNPKLDDASGGQHQIPSGDVGPEQHRHHLLTPAQEKRVQELIDRALKGHKHRAD